MRKLHSQMNCLILSTTKRIIRPWETEDLFSVGSCWQRMVIEWWKQRDGKRIFGWSRRRDSKAFCHNYASFPLVKIGDNIINENKCWSKSFRHHYEHPSRKSFKEKWTKLILRCLRVTNVRQKAKGSAEPRQEQWKLPLLDKKRVSSTESNNILVVLHP